MPPFLEPDPKSRKPNKKSQSKVAADRKLLDQIHGDLKEARKNLSEWRKEGQEADDMFAGHQWSDDDAAILKDQDRPQITFNRIKPVIMAITGTEIQHRQKIVFLPRHPPKEDVAAASDLATDAVDWAITRTRGEYERSMAFKDCVIRGIGIVGLSLDFEEDPEGKLTMERIDTDEVLWDHHARKQNNEDLKWVARRRWMSVKEVKEMFPDADIEPTIDTERPGEEAPEDEDLPTEIRMSNPDPYKDGAQKVTRGLPEPGDKGMIMVTEYQYYEKETYFRVLESDVPPEETGAPAGMGTGMPPAESPPPPPAPGGLGLGAPPMPPPTPPVNGGAPPMGGPPPGMPPMPPPPGMPPPGMPPMGGPPGMPPAPPAMPPGMVGGPEMGGPSPSSPPQEPAPKWISLSNDEYQKLVERLNLMEQPPPPAVKLRRRKYRQCYVTGGVVLDKRDMWMKGFSYKFITCLWDSKKRYWYGLVRAMMDPQRGANKWFSQGVHHFNSGAKGALLVETQAVVNPTKLANDWAKPRAIIQLKAGALQEGRIKVEAPPPFPEAAASMIQYAIAALRDSTGVNVEMLGASEGEESGVTVQKRQTQGLTILAGIYSALSRYREDEALTILGILKEHLSDGRWIRIGGPYNSTYRQLLQEDFAEDYDMVIDDEPRDPNMKRETWDQLQPLLPILIREGQMPEGIIDYAPLPASVIASIKKSQREQQQAAASQPPPVKKEESPEYVAALVDREKAAAELDRAKAKAISAETGIGVAKTAQEMLLEREGKGMEVEQEKQIGEAKVQAQREATAAKKEETQQKLQAKQEEHAMNRQQKESEHAMEAERSQQQHGLDMQQAQESHAMNQASQIKKLNDPGTPESGGVTDPSPGGMP